MEKIKRFEDLFIWQEARVLSCEIYNSMKGCRDYSLRDQFQRAGISIMNNIAEGFERHSDKDFVLFLKYAMGSSGEVRSMTYLAEDLGIITATQAEEFRGRCKKISAGIKHLKSSVEERNAG